MQRTGHAFLANAGLAEDEHAGHRGSQSFNCLAQRFHRGGLADQQVFGPQRRAAIQLNPKLLRVHDLGQGFPPALVVVRLEQHVVRAVPGGGHYLGGTEGLAHDDITAIGLCEPDPQVRPI